MRCPACDGTTNPPPNNVLGGASDIQAGSKCLFLAPAERADIIIDFGPPYGLWQYDDGGTWSQLHSTSPEGVVAGRFH